MLTIRPIDLKSANEFVMKHHRHNGKVLVHRFSISCYDGDRLCGVAICGNPVARMLCDGNTVEVYRCCTDGTKNACSCLYGRCAKIAKDMGFKKIMTYITEDETGVSLRAAGFNLEEDNCSGTGRNRNTPSRPRVIQEVNLFGEKTASYPIGKKKRYSKTL